MSEGSEPARLRLGDCELLRPLGRGGVGTVWEAWQIPLRRLVAVKVLDENIGTDDHSRERFRSEAEAGARLNHPGIVSVHSVGEQDGTLYIVQELVEGGRNLADVLDDMRRLPELPDDYYPHLARMMLDAAEALHAAHAAGVVHRDVKPSNLLVDAAGRLKIADFGIARIENALTLSRTGDFLGTPFYMSPEQAEGRRRTIDHRTDVFSLGATFYEALTLARPFDGDTSQQVLQKIVLEDPPDPRKLRSRVPRDLALVCCKALEKDPGRRYPSMREFADDVQRHLQGRPILAKPPHALVKARRWAARHPVRALGVIALATVTGLLIRVNSEAERATLAEAAAQLLAQQERAESETATAALSVLVDSFQQADPDVARGKELTASELVGRAADRISTQLLDQPVARSRLLASLGSVLLTLGNATAALPLLEEARTIETSLGEDLRRDPQDTPEKLAMACWKLGRYDEAEELLLEVITARTRVQGASDPETLSSLLNLSSVYQSAERFAEAEPLVQQAVDGLVNTKGEADVETLKAMNALGVLRLRLRRPDEAAELLQRCLDLAVANHGEDHSTAISARGNLASALLALRRTDEAVALLDAALTAQRRVAGDDHPSTLLLQSNLANLHQAQGRLADAESGFLAVVAARRASQAADHPDLLRSLNNLAYNDILRGQLDRARSLLEEAVAGYERSGGTVTTDACNAWSNLARVHAGTGRDAEAETLALKSLDGRRRLLPAGHPHVLLSLQILVESRLHLGKAAEAEAPARELVAGTNTADPAAAARAELLAEVCRLLGKPLDPEPSPASER